MDLKFKCPVCKQEYPTKGEAEQCFKRYGVPRKVGYKVGDTVKIKRGTEINIGRIISFVFTSPDLISRQPHTLIYLIALKPYTLPYTLTTVVENEIIEQITT